MNREKAHILLIEDEPVSAGITRRMLGEAGLDPGLTVKGTLQEGLEELKARGADLVLLDMGLPDSSGPGTVKELCGLFPGLPVIVMTGSDDDEIGLEALKYGAQDYLVKSQFGYRELKRAITYSLERKELLNEKEELVKQLQETLRHVHRLTGLLPTCADCKKIRTPAGDWVQMESYISLNSDAQFTHGFCDNCYKKRLKELP
jgi:DNA-binding response OmpR family regulator